MKVSFLVRNLTLHRSDSSLAQNVELMCSWVPDSEVAPKSQFCLGKKIPPQHLEEWWLCRKGGIGSCTTWHHGGGHCKTNEVCHISLEKAAVAFIVAWLSRPTAQAHCIFLLVSAHLFWQRTLETVRLVTAWQNGELKEKRKAFPWKWKGGVGWLH